jgi:hypothetical protein
MQFESYTCIQTKVREWNSREITLSKNHPTMTKFELDLHNPMMYPYIKFELNVCNRSIDEQKPIYGMTKGNTICPRPFHGGGIKKVLKTDNS